jgi:hypothetical protein
MPKSPDFNESRLLEAIATAKKQKRPNIAKIAREFNVPDSTLRTRLKKPKIPATPTTTNKNLLQPYQEKALINWIVQMRKWNIPPTPAVIAAWANQTLARAGSDKRVSKMWPYRFESRVPADLGLAPVKQKTKELRRIQAEDAGLLQHWYDLLKSLLRGVPARLVYNFDECGFQPGKGRDRKVFGGPKCPDLAESERGENVTAVECIAADGWVMDPFFIFKATGNHMEVWYHGAEQLPPETTTAISSNGWITDELALAWLHRFNTETKHPDRTKQGEKRYLIFDGHGSHLTLEFLQYCEENDIIPFGFIAHSTHLCQPLDGKPFLAYKTNFHLKNNELSQWGGKPHGKAEFLKIIQPIRNQTFLQRIIRDAFKERGIWPVDGTEIIKKLANQMDIPDISIDLCRTPSPPPLLSSSVENSPPATMEALLKNQAKVTKELDKVSDRARRNISKLFQYQAEKLEELKMTQEAIQRIRAAQEPQRRVYTKRQIKGLSSDGVLRVRDAIRSIEGRKAKDAERERKRLAKQMKKVYGSPPPPRSQESIQRGIDNARHAEEAGEFFYFDY